MPQPSFIALFAMLAYAGIANAAGPPYVIDGDTIIIQGEKIRLAGIDAPELAQKCFHRKNGAVIQCGIQARAFLIRIIAEGPVQCRPVAPRDKYGRIIGLCHDASGRDIARSMVMSGWAVIPINWPTPYRRAELQARRAGRGLWKTRFVHPQQYRRLDR